jgi:hypothetical protein
MAATPKPELPASLLDGVEQVVMNHLSIASLRHRSALHRLRQVDGLALVAAIDLRVRDNYSRGKASANKDRSRQNWRWQSLQPQIGPHNRSPEVVVERAIAAACSRLGRTDWANQVPVASGLIAGARDGRRAIDPVQRRGDRHFEFVELKISSDTPLYAAIEIIGYGCLWTIARSDPPQRPSAILDADHVDLRVLAPASFYAPFALEGLEITLDAGLAALGRVEGTVMSFAFDVLPDGITALALPDADDLLDLLDRRQSLHRSTPA